MRRFITAAAVIALSTAGASAQPDWPDWDGECNMDVADRNGDGILDFADIIDFIEAYIAQDESADINGDGITDFADIYAYIEAIIPCFR